MGGQHVLALMDAFNAAWNAHDLAAAIELCTEDVVFETTFPAPDGRRVEGRAAVQEEWLPIFRDSEGRFDVEEIFVADDRVVQRWRYTWATGHVRGVDVLRLRSGRIAEKLSYVKG
jgi:ketosteroid isomerase-like protein